jgi:hypothetical protein
MLYCAALNRAPVGLLPQSWNASDAAVRITL